MLYAYIKKVDVWFHLHVCNLHFGRRNNNGPMKMSSAANDDGGASKKKKKKSLMAAGISSLLLIAVVGTVATVAVRNSASEESPGEIQSSVKSIQSICGPTDFPKQCEDSLNKVAGNTSDPNELIQAAFKATIDRIRYAFNHSQTIQAAAKDPRTSEALNNCREVFNYAIDDLQNSVKRFREFDMSKLDKVVDDLKIWLSAVVTYQETCIDGFANTTGPAAASMKKALNASSQLASNALAIVDDISSVLDDFQFPLFSRRLLSAEEDGAAAGESPPWADPAERRILFDMTAKLKPNLVVAKDGSGDYKTITKALEHVPEKLKTVFVIYVKEGVYKEQVTVGKSLTNLMMYGDGPTKTRVTGHLNYIDGSTTFKSASFIAVGEGFMAKDMGFENSAGPEKHQAVALRVQSDRAVFYNCHMDGYQDTLYAHTHRQFYRDCTITGTIDFIFGDGAAYFQNCKIIVRRPMDNQQTIVTAQGRKERREATGIVLHNCTISADPEYVKVAGKLKAYLGRPWKEYSRTLIIQTQIDEFIQPQGWLPWSGDFALKTCLYGEYDNRGPGSKMDKRATWHGVKKVDYDRAVKYTVQYFLQGNDWLPGLGVPYTQLLLPLSDQTKAKEEKEKAQ